MKISIIIPFFNEGNTILKVLKKIQEVKLGDVEKEIILVDDGSTDNWVKGAEKHTKDVKLIKKKNEGKGSAIKEGIRSATGDYILIQDADLEYDPVQIPVLLLPILERKTEVVYGTRLNRLPNLLKDEKKPIFLLHYFGNRILSLLTSILYGQWLTDMETGYKIFPTSVAKQIHLQSRSFDFEPEITAKLLKKGLKITEIPISTNPRDHAEGKKLNTVKDGMIALWTLLKYRVVD